MKFSEIKSSLKNKTVGIAGCGGLGSNCAVSLARVGIGKLVIADFDVIEESNLNRQYFFFDQIGKYKAPTLKENLLRINPAVSVEDYVIKLTPKDIVELYKDCDVIVEAFDKAEMKEMIVETVLSEFPQKQIVCGVGLAGWGGNNLLRTEQYRNLFIVGDRSNETSEDNPPLAPRVGAVSNMMANVVLEILLGKDK
ncbi:MAG: thiamine biosynthesis protein ThiF [Stygiobacter sp. RIFOXYC12_FULL_38_8]|nr:MAG: thiamine biosynthesis protein ThiF [Stygiobacter sp. GWC2_38_9]OGU80521.1 MAG: thiamine biosynthesis protein ThiF [Stygiobacter sp. RIFOXYA12_FULL_38_9]OGV08439.1 MAG: thiamine biosynthesis protein ThiF [Stygiobacter sp. RIFOXYB2_FULL_37_11]OGV12019.1 MAG: thiamine biosynthesis protein ThiF [Stygiobacter sp. RIFOXYA2_FULL_38_8]OGV14394.1 MAG: thiamine biosynthesis protein ThiF [Stygiobacter sp. RIFOXYC2_FULL_38_25]OGV25517.1 MAG: thiamine biosynthesis protein ThiF [Stygiobacter sp. RIF